LQKGISGNKTLVENDVQMCASEKRENQEVVERMPGINTDFSKDNNIIRWEQQQKIKLVN